MPLPTRQDFINGKEDLDALGEMVNSAEDKLVDTRFGGLKRTLANWEARWAEAIANAGGVPVGDGNYTAGKTYTNYNHYTVDNGTPYRTVTIPYAVDSATYPNAADDPNLRPWVFPGELANVRIKWYSTLADLLLAPLQAGEYAGTVNRIEVGDGGGAVYAVKPAGTAADGFADHDMANGRVAALLRGGTKNIAHYGAILDGSYDCTAAIAAAIADLQDGDTLLIPKGVAGLSSDDGQVRPSTGLPSGNTPVKFTIDGRRDITITGGGRLKLLGGNNYHLFNITGCERVAIRGIEVEGNRNPSLPDLNYDGEAGEFFRFFDCTEVDISSNFMTLYSITAVRVGAGCHRFVVSGNIAYDGNDCFVQVGDASVATQVDVPSDITICGNVIDKFYTDSGIKVRYCADRVTISGNTITSYLGTDTQTASAIMVRGGLSGAFNTTNINVIGNTLCARVTDAAGTGVIDPVLAVPAISMFENNSLNAPENVMIQGNICRGSITLAGHNVKCIDNMVAGGIDKLNGGTGGGDVEISRNKISVESSVDLQAISIGAGDYRAIVLDNIVESDRQGHLLSVQVSDVQICGNHLVSSASGGLGRGISVFGIESGLIAGNSIRGVKERGIYVASSGAAPKQVLVQGNVVDDPGSVGIEVSASVAAIVRVRDNMVRGAGVASYKNNCPSCVMQYESTAQPTFTAQVGDTAFNSAPTVGGPFSWVYTVSGWAQGGAVS